jgi:hypothetical protein
MSPLSADSTVSVTPSPSTSPENKYSKSLGSSAYTLSQDSKQMSRIILSQLSMAFVKVQTAYFRVLCRQFVMNQSTRNLWNLPELSSVPHHQHGNLPRGRATVARVMTGFINLLLLGPL